MIVGDLNIPVNKRDDPHVKMYERLLHETQHENNIVQWVGMATHAGGNTLDPVCTREDDDAIQQPLLVHVAESPGPVSDHALLVVEPRTRMDPFKKKKIKYRRWDSLDNREFW